MSSSGVAWSTAFSSWPTTTSRAVVSLRNQRLSAAWWHRGVVMLVASSNFVMGDVGVHITRERTASTHSDTTTLHHHDQDSHHVNIVPSPSSYPPPLPPASLATLGDVVSYLGGRTQLQNAVEMGADFLVRVQVTTDTLDPTRFQDVMGYPYGAPIAVKGVPGGVVNTTWKGAFGGEYDLGPPIDQRRCAEPSNIKVCHYKRMPRVLNKFRRQTCCIKPLVDILSFRFFIAHTLTVVRHPSIFYLSFHVCRLSFFGLLWHTGQNVKALLAASRIASSSEPRREKWLQSAVLGAGFISDKQV